MDDLTLQFLRGGEFFSNDLFDHSGGHGEPKTILQRAHERVEEILKTHWPEPLDPDIRKRIEDYVKSVEKREAKR